MKTYSTEEAAFKRVQLLRRQGIWPGVIRKQDGTFELTHDPGDEVRA